MPDGQQNTTAFEIPAKAPWRKSRRGRMIIAIAAIGIVSLASVWFVDYWTVGRFLQSTNNAYLRADSVTISPKISGYVKEVLVADNQTIAAGAPLLRVESTAYQATRDLAEAEVAQRKADLTRFIAEVARQEAVRAEASPRQPRVSPVRMRHDSSG
jgi:membrane fusion protein (multidrug efflux system)